MKKNKNHSKNNNCNRESLYLIRKTMENEPGLMDGSIGVAVDNNKAILAGSVQSKTYMEKVLQLVKGNHKLRCIENYLVVAKKQSQKDHSLARHIKSVLKSYFIESTLYVSVIFDRVMIFGKVDSNAKRNLVEKTVKKHFDNISKVENFVIAA